MGDYSADILDFPLAPKPAAPVANDSGYGPDMDLLAGSAQTAAKGAVVGALDANPDAAGKAINLAPRVGAPAVAVETDLPAFEAQDHLQRSSGFINENPSLAEWLASDPMHARIAKDDFDKLNFVTKATKALSSGLHGALLANQRGRLGSQAMLGEDVTQPLQKLNRDISANPELDGLYGKLQTVSGFLGGMLDNFLHGGVQAAQGAAAGALAGAAATPEVAGAGALAGAPVGAAVGFGVGWKWDMSRIAAGNAYLNLSQTKGEDGADIPVAAREAASVLVGLGTYALAGVGQKTVAKAGSDAAGKLLADAVSQAATRPTVQRALTTFGTSLAKAGVQGAALNAAMEGVNIFGEEFAKQLAGGADFETVFNDPMKRQEAVDQLITAAGQGAALFPLVHLPLAAGSLVGDTLRARTAAADQAAFATLETGAVGSKTRERSSGAFQTFMERQTGGSPVENLGLTGEAVRTLYQSAGRTPGPGDGLLGDIVPDLSEQMQQSRATGGDIIVPTAAYVAHLAGTPISEALRADIRFRPDGMTMREAGEYEAQRGEHLASLAAAGRDEAAGAPDPTGQVVDDIRGKLRAAGVTADAADQYATLVASRYEARAAAFEGARGTALDLYQGEGLQVRRQLPETLRAPVEDIDLAINALRNPDRKAATAKELYGPSLHEAVRAAGGIVDTGGELRRMDLDKKPYRGLVRKVSGDKTADIEHSADAMALRMWEMGYFPEHFERPSTDDLFDAMRSGDKRYSEGANDERKADFEQTVRDLDEFTNRAGIDIKKASNAEIKAAIARGLDETDSGRSFEQGERGKLDISDNATTITLFKDADLSTFLHETGHQWLEEMSRDAVHEAAPEAFKQDAATIAKWLGADDLSTLTTEQHEKFARGFETYLMEGRAPSGALAGAFRKFKSWLTRIYKSVAALNAPINGEIRAVFDRMVASEDQIASWRQAEGLNPVFAEAKDAGMTDAEFASYTKAVAKARAAADQKMIDRTMDAVRKTRTAEWKAEAAGVREEVSQQVRSQPDMKAQYFLRTGKMLDDPEAPAMEKVRLSRSALDEMYGTDEASKALPSGIVAADGGVHPDEIAPLFGYASGDEMVKALMSLEARRKAAEEATGQRLDGQQYVRKVIDDRTQDIMLERHGDALNDGSIEDEALAAVHNAAQADVLSMEARAIARQAGQTPLRMDDIKAWADDQISTMPVERGTDVRRFARVEAKAGREVERALLKGDARAAFEAKQRQLINHVLGMKASEAAEEYAAAQKLFSRYASKATIKSMDQSYLDRIHQILKLIGYSTKRSDAELAGSSVADASLEKWADQQAEGLDYPYVPDFLKDGGWRKAQLSDLTTGEMRDIKDAITSISKIGRNLKTMEIDGKRIDLADLIEEAREAAKDMPSIDARKSLTFANATMGERLGIAMRFVNADLLAQETVFNALDHGKIDGVFTRTVLRPLKEGLFSRDKRLGEMVRKLDDIRKTMPRGWSGHLLDKIDTPELIDQRTGRPWSLTRGEMIGIMLNMGNESNLTKMLKGEGWDESGVRDVVNRYAKKEDWDFVQSIWDMHESIAPDIDALTRRDTGVGLDRVEAKPVETPHGTFKGGYYPMEYDRTRAYDVEKRQQRAESLAGDNYHRAGTVSGHTKGRVERYAAPLDFSLDLIPFRLGQHIHDLYMREAVKQADRFLGNDKVRALVEDKFGREYYKEFRPWLQTIAQDRNINDRAQSWLTKFLNGARANATVLGIGFRVTTMLRHGMTALTNSFGAVGPTHMLKAVQYVYANPGQTKARIQFALDNSTELPHRFDSLDRDTREALERNLGNTIAGGVDKIQGGHVVKGAASVASGVRAGAIRYSHYGIATLDMASAIPTWYAGREKYLAENPGASAKDANYAGDKAVRDAHGAQSVVDLPAIQRGPAVQKLFTMFYGFMNRMYNRTYEGVRAGRSGVAALKDGRGQDARRDFAMMLNRLAYSVVVPAMADAFVAGTIGKEVEKEGETWWDWFAKAIAGGAAAQVPLVRDIADAALHPGRDYQMSPVERAFTTGLQSEKDLEAVFSDDKDASPRWVQHAIETPGYVFGLPTGQPASGAQYLWDLNNGNVDPETASDVLKGVLFGPPPKGK